MYVEFRTVPLRRVEIDRLFAALEARFLTAGGGMGGGDGEPWHGHVRLDPQVDTAAERERLRTWLAERVAVTWTGLSDRTASPRVSS